jgi:hypothetical protein
MLSESEFKLYALREKSYVPDQELERRFASLRIESDDLTKSLAEAQAAENAQTEALIANIRRLIANNQEAFAKVVVERWAHKAKHVSPERTEYYHGYSIKTEADLHEIVAQKLAIEMGGVA